MPFAGPSRLYAAAACAALCLVMAGVPSIVPDASRSLMALARGWPLGSVAPAGQAQTPADAPPADVAAAEDPAVEAPLASGPQRPGTPQVAVTPPSATPVPAAQTTAPTAAKTAAALPARHRTAALLPPGTSKPRPKDEPLVVMGFYTDEEPGLPGSLATARSRSALLSCICPFWYQVGFDGEGTIVPFGAYDEAEARQVVQGLQDRGVKVLALLHNMRLGQPQDTRANFHRILSSPARRARLVRNTLALLRRMGFDGLNLDTESVPPGDRRLFTAFVAEMSAALRREGYLFTADLPAKTTDDPDHSWSGAFDIKALAKYLDLVAVMTYDEHGYATGPGPVASIGWVEDVVRYTVTVVPPRKLLLGLAGHAFDWQGDSKQPRYAGYAHAAETARRTGTSVRWDEDSLSPYLAYSEDEAAAERQIWFENARSYAAKLDLVDEYGLGGICLWRLGLEDPALWDLLDERYEVKR